MSSSPVQPDEGSGRTEVPMPVSSIPEPLTNYRDACRDALGSYSADSRNFELVRAAIHSLAAAARQHDLSPEQMLIELKTMLAESPVLRDLAPPRADAARTQLVSVAIRAYFSEHDS